MSIRPYSSGPFLQRYPLVGISNIHPNREGFSSCFSDLEGNVLSAIAVQVPDRYVSPLSGEGYSDGLSDAGSAPVTTETFPWHFIIPSPYGLQRESLECETYDRAGALSL